MEQEALGFGLGGRGSCAEAVRDSQGGSEWEGGGSGAWFKRPGHRES